MSFQFVDRYEYGPVPVEPDVGAGEGGLGDPPILADSRLTTLRLLSERDEPFPLDEPSSGDGQFAGQSLGYGRRAHGTVYGYRSNILDLPVPGLLTKPTPPAESWKLVGLVFIFFVWIATAGTLLFFYMDRYLFG